MAPTIQSGHLNDRDKRQRQADKKSELVCRIKYCNTLPDIPFDPKFITYPFETNRFVHYNPTSLERNYKHDLLTEHDLGVPIDLINTDTYAINTTSVLDIADEKLLEEEISIPQDSKRSRHHAKSVSWLRRTEYISTEYTRFQPSADKTETKVGYNVKRLFKEQDLYRERDEQIKEIDKTFEDTKKPIERHHTKPGIHAVEILPLFPDFEMWKYPCAQVIFDSDPAPTGRPLPAQLEEMSQAMIRGVMDESGEQFVAYFLPTDETLGKRKRDVDNAVDYEDEEEYDYKMAREYNWNVKNKASKGYEENYFFVFRNSGVYYNELETRVRLSKRRTKPGSQPNNSRLIVRHRPLNELEFKTQEVRMMQLEPPQEEEDEPEPEVKEPEKETEEASDDEDEQPKPAKRRRVSGSDDENSNDADSNAEKGSAKEESDGERSVAGSGSGSEKGEEDSDHRVADEDDDDEKEERVASRAKSRRRSSGSRSDASRHSSGAEDSDAEAATKPARSSGSEKEDESDAEDTDRRRNAKEKAKSDSSGGESSDEESGSGKSKSSSSSSKSSSSGESSESEAEEEDKRKKRDEEEIFGSGGSDSD